MKTTENRNQLTTILRRSCIPLLLALPLILLTACNEGSGGGNVETYTITGNAGGELRAFSPDVQGLMPAIAAETNAPRTAEQSREPDCDLSGWDNGWHPAKKQSALHQLLSTEDESVWGALGRLDQFIEILNNLSNQWDIEGQVSSADNTKVITIRNDIDHVWVPFYSGNVGVDRLISVTDSKSRTRIHLAFADRAVAGEERLVAHYEKEDGSEAGVFYTWRDVSTGDVSIWHAHSARSTMNFKWTGNLEEGWFTVSLVTNQCSGGFQMMGGGVMENVGPVMAFIAKNNDTGNTIEEWYTLLTLKNITDATAYPAVPENTTRKPLQGDGISKFIAASENHPRGATNWCPGWITTNELPNGAGDIAWDN